jgi:hypothetical protein
VARFDCWSTSRERIPDIVLWRREAGGPGTLVVLDAKYRAARANVLDAMATAHVYRDALRTGDLRPVASLLLVPAGGGAPWLEDPTWWTEHGVGIVPFAPGTRCDPAFLSLLLGGPRSRYGDWDEP